MLVPPSLLRRGIVALAIGIAACGGGGTTPATPSAPSPPSPSPTQDWIENFDGPANSLPDPARWSYDLGNNNGWGNRELENYTNQTQNVHLDGAGHLVIHVQREGSGYTSARLKTQGKFSAKFGRIEARMRLPFGQGIWPAFWMLGASFNGSNWPACGEIDIMENIGREPSVVHGTVHGPGYSGGSGISRSFTLPGAARFADDFHVFAIAWAPQAITFEVDGAAYETVTPASLPGGATWVFDNPFFLLLNVAVGGTFPGDPDATSVFPQEMVVDYVRVTGSSTALRAASQSGRQ
jgi:beta-glucanase (GH16 family)